jgi:hypothetical protein
MSHFNKHTIVVGSARSGTSWLSENMAKVLRYRMLFKLKLSKMDLRYFIFNKKIVRGFSHHYCKKLKSPTLIIFENIKVVLDQFNQSLYSL